MKLILESYRTPELRGFVREHNRKLRKEIAEEIKDIRKKIKAKRLINVTGKKREEIIDIMMKNKNVFKDLKMREGKSESEKTRILDEVMQPILEKGVLAYEKTADKKALRKVFVALRGIAKRNDITIDDTLGKQVEKQIKEIESSKKKITKLETQESIDKLIEVFDLDTKPKKVVKIRPKKKKIKLKTADDYKEISMEGNIYFVKDDEVLNETGNILPSGKLKTKVLKYTTDKDFKKRVNAIYKKQLEKSIKEAREKEAIEKEKKRLKKVKKT